MFTVFADGAKGVVGFDWNGVGVSVVLHFEKTSPSVADYIALALALATEWNTNLIPLQSNDLLMADVTVYDLSAEDAPKYVDSSQNGTPGGQVQDSVPNNTSVLASHRTTATGRSGRGRTYIPGFREDEEANGIMTVVSQTAYVLGWGNFITAVELTGWAFVIAQRFLNGVQLSTGVMRDVVTLILKKQLGTQRRRQVQSAS